MEMKSGMKSGLGLGIGIDLGTTHTAMAVLDDDGPNREPKICPILQAVSRSELQRLDVLPSFMYFTHESEGQASLPWDEKKPFTVGRYAQKRGGEALNRVIFSAKSWLCHTGVDRRAALLPQHAPKDITPISPLEASFRYLEHLVQNYAYERPESDLRNEEVVLTVPASFDAQARELTLEAARTAGLNQITLLEEPQAALYAWLARQGESWRSLLRAGDVILVVDVGGGTTDFSALFVDEKDGHLELIRVAVGDHILLGGDNMDWLLAHLAKTKMEAQGKTIDPSELQSLVFMCRTAKEKMLEEENLTHYPISFSQRGSNLFANTVKIELSRSEIEEVIIRGFFPDTRLCDLPQERKRSALSFFGLPYAQDTAITKHLAAFLTKQKDALKEFRPDQANGALLRPTFVLFNGGVMKSTALRTRVLYTLNAWLEEDGAPQVKEMGDADYNLAVAKGAAFFAHLKLIEKSSGRSPLRIRSSTASSYYVGIERNVLTIPGMDPPIELLCIAGFNMEEGSRIDLNTKDLAMPELGLVLGETSRFRFFSSTSRRSDKPGTFLTTFVSSEIEEMTPIEVTLFSSGRTPGELVSVYLGAELTEIGLLKLVAFEANPKDHEPERWEVQLSTRES